MERFQFHPSAEADLVEILDYIGPNDYAAAAKVLDKFEQTFSALGHSPLMGHTRPDLNVAPLRFQTVWKYLVVYHPETRPITIIAVVHGMRDPATIAEILSRR